MMIKECNQLIQLKHTHETSKYLVSDKEEIKCNNVIKWYKKWLALMML